MRIAQASAAMNRSAAPNPATSAAQAGTLGSSELRASGSPAGSAGSRAQFGFSDTRAPSCTR
ncbi:hypothetical protein PR003_g7511 [Phytophthora rubi]|uniref:Uncharacterized protein n=1 Tax=Phytophthora rubi TaxID=129364 RepID=A0A6A4FJN1_9STRA|nr:hypothetical protein PR001_g3942 [Phytophthora rubi]KAE9346286.1 hypothetical protein PR003_g7511 [Phytophthora rubi]